MEAKRASNDRVYLNVGCGSHFSPEWNNLDLFAKAGVIAHDVRRALPYPEKTFDAVYSSHVLEHLIPAQGRFFLSEQLRVLKPGGICRIAVPDLERNCRDYLAQLQKAENDPSAANLLDYKWGVLQLIDQLVREEYGGEMIKSLRQREYNLEFIQSRFGDEFSGFIRQLSPAGSKQDPSHWQVVFQVFKTRVKRFLRRDARSRGEAHLWMYDRLSLRLLLTEMGFIHFRVLSHIESSIPGWETYHLDSSNDQSGARKPDSLYVEAATPQ